MRAGHGGAGKEKSFGVAIRLPFEQGANDIIADDPKLINFKYFFTRKLMFMKEASAVALFPGGFGTQDEGFEALTLVQTGKAGIMPIVMVDAPGRTYWQQWRSYVERELLANKMIDPEDTNLFTITDDADRAVHEILRFYRRYHSARFVNDELVLRLSSPVGDDGVQRLNDTFSDIVTSGRIEAAAGPIAGENGELPGMSRLRFRFNRRSHGRLRRMIDMINEIP
jgi:predicted Rossmann-fold nucleotide-binding protein